MLKNFFYNNKILVYFFFYLTLLLGYFLNEDLLGGAKADYTYHLRFIHGFSENFSHTFKYFGSTEKDLNTRNLPTFFIIISYLTKYLDLELIRLLNMSAAIAISYVFYKCLIIKFINTNKNDLFLISLFVFLSPSIRSLSIWPYTLIWGLLVFLISVYYYLKFIKSSKKNKFKYSIYNSIFLAISSYIYPSFSVFILYFYYNYIVLLKERKKIVYITLLNLILSLPAIYFIITHKFYFLEAEGVSLSKKERYNPFNKILLISTIIFYYIIPFLNFKYLIKNFFSKISIKIFIIISITSLTIISLFNYSTINYFGGGFFFKLSHYIIKNNSLTYIVFLMSLLFFYTYNFFKIKNLIILICLILFNTQFTIYHKYFDPLIIIIAFLLIKSNLLTEFFKRKNFIIKFYFFIISYYLIALISKRFIYTI